MASSKLTAKEEGIQVITNLYTSINLKCIEMSNRIGSTLLSLYDLSTILA